MGIPQLSQAAVVVIGSSSWVNAGVLVRGGLADESPEAGDEGLGPAGGPPGHGAGPRLCAQPLPVPIIGHVISVPTSRSIVNPDGSAVPGPRLRLAGRVRLAGCGRYARSLVWIGETLPAAGHPRRGRGGR